MESKILDDIRVMILTYKEDNPHIVITQQTIEEIVEQYKEEIAKEIMEQL